MKYETPEVIELAPAIHAIQGTNGTHKSSNCPFLDNKIGQYNDCAAAYVDWED